MAQALGYHLLDEQGHELRPGGLALKRLARIHVGGVHASWKDASVAVACDVTNPLTGPNGASAIYGPQKGATPAMVIELDAALRRFAGIVGRDLGLDIEHIPGAGAAGGLGGGLVAFCGGQLKPGAELVMSALKFSERLEGANLVITGEGRLDSQTARFGKGPAAVARHAREARIPVIAIGGSVADEKELALLFDAVESTVTEADSLDGVLRHAREGLTRAASRVFRLLLTGRRLTGSA
jgi:glycerate kinase